MTRKRTPPAPPGKSPDYRQGWKDAYSAAWESSGSPGGRKGGRSTSEAKRRAARENGRKGGKMYLMTAEAITFMDSYCDHLEAELRRHEQDPKNREAGASMRLLEKAGIDKNLCAKFRIGHAHGNPAKFAEFMQSAGYTEKEKRSMAIGLNLLVVTDTREYPRFWARTMIPCVDLNRDVVGFVGINVGEPSSVAYLRTTTNSRFLVTSFVFGLIHAAAEIKRSGHAVFRDSFMDAIRDHKNGESNSVSILGTKITPEHVAAVNACGAKSWEFKE